MSGKIRTLPTTMVTGLWDPGSDSKIPERIKVCMADGSRAVYLLSVEQPHPQCLKAIENIRNMTTGYERKNTVGRT